MINNNTVQRAFIKSTIEIKRISIVDIVIVAIGNAAKTLNITQRLLRTLAEKRYGENGAS